MNVQLVASLFACVALAFAAPTPDPLVEQFQTVTAAYCNGRYPKNGTGTAFLACYASNFQQNPQNFSFTDLTNACVSPNATDADIKNKCNLIPSNDPKDTEDVKAVMECNVDFIKNKSNDPAREIQTLKENVDGCLTNGSTTPDYYTTGASTDYSTPDASADYSTTDASTDFSTPDASTDYSTTDASTDYSTADASTDYSTTDASTDYSPDSGDSSDCNSQTDDSSSSGNSGGTSSCESQCDDNSSSGNSDGSSSCESQCDDYSSSGNSGGSSGWDSQHNDDSSYGDSGNSGDSSTW